MRFLKTAIQANVGERMLRAVPSQERELYVIFFLGRRRSILRNLVGKRISINGLPRTYRSVDVILPISTTLFLGAELTELYTITADAIMPTGSIYAVRFQTSKKRALEASAYMAAVP